MDFKHPPAIMIERCTKQVCTGGVKRIILEDVSLQVKRGELMVVLGENGAGKTTLLKLIAGLALPDKGRIESTSTVAYCGVGDRAFYYRLSIGENLRFFATLLGLEGRRRTQRITEVVEITDIASALEQRFSEVSSGIRQRLAFARALLQDPEILAFDEPTRAIDPAHAKKLRHFLRNTLVTGLGKTVLVATNQLDEARELADRIVLVAHGALHEMTSLASLESYV